MPTPATKVRIFVASPSDVQSERDQLAKVVQELNITLSALAPAAGIVLELVRWETHVHPGLGRDAQGVVNQQIGPYDIFVAIMWRRFGTKTAVAGSGTEEEFRTAYRAWEEKRKSLELIFYFCQAAAAPPATKDEVDQLGRVIDLRTELTQKGLVGEYDDHGSFADTVRPHLVLVLGRMLNTTPVSAAAATVSPTDLDVTRREVSALAAQYEQIRKEMLPGDPRTRRMEVVASRMRALALSTFPLLAELTASESPGKRLAAVATLQSIPDPLYLPWLGARLTEERPFIGYHAAMALLHAARSLDPARLGEIRAAITLARRKSLRPDTDRDTTLRLAEEEVARRLTQAGSTPGGGPGRS